MKKDYSDSLETMVSKFVYRDCRDYIDEIKDGLKGISSLLWVLIIIAIINLFI